VVECEGADASRFLGGSCHEVAEAFARATPGIAADASRPSLPPAPFGRVVGPLVARARARVRDGLSALADRRSAPGVESDALDAAANQGLAGRLVAMATRCLVLDLHGCRLGRLRGESPESDSRATSIASKSRARLGRPPRGSVLVRQMAIAPMNGSTTR
jgi:DNA-binding transcriptional LysR family regulator